MTARSRRARQERQLNVAGWPGVAAVEAQGQEEAGLFFLRLQVRPVRPVAEEVAEHVASLRPLVQGVSSGFLQPSPNPKAHKIKDVQILLHVFSEETPVVLRSQSEPSGRQLLQALALWVGPGASQNLRRVRLARTCAVPFFQGSFVRESHRKLRGHGRFVKRTMVHHKLIATGRFWWSGKNGEATPRTSQKECNIFGHQLALKAAWEGLKGAGFQGYPKRTSTNTYHNLDLRGALLLPFFVRLYHHTRTPTQSTPRMNLPSWSNTFLSTHCLLAAHRLTSTTISCVWAHFSLPVFAALCVKNAVCLTITELSDRTLER